MGSLPLSLSPPGRCPAPLAGRAANPESARVQVARLGGGFPQGPGSARWRMSGLGLPVSVAAASGFEVAFESQTRKSPIPVPPIPDLAGKWGGNFKFRFPTRPGTGTGIEKPPVSRFGRETVPNRGPDWPRGASIPGYPSFKLTVGYPTEFQKGGIDIPWTRRKNAGMPARSGWLVSWPSNCRNYGRQVHWQLTLLLLEFA